MSWTKKSVIIAMIPTLAILVGVLYKAKEILALEPGGIYIFIACLLAAVLSWVAVAFEPAYDYKRYPLLVAAVFFAAPMINVMVVERMNGNFLSDLWHICWLDNYCVALLVYFLVFALSGSVRISVLTLSPFFFVFGLANMYVKEFKGGPLVPMDVGSIATATTVAGQYTYGLGAEVVFALSLTIMAMALACRLKMPKRSRKVKLISRIVPLAIVGIMAGLFYGTDIFVKLGYRPDFFNQTRGYEHYGAILNFTENTRYLRMSKPDDYDTEKLEKKVNAAVGSGEPPSILRQALSGEQGQAENPTEAGKTTQVENQKRSIENPDIIVVMDEAFSDLSIIGDFKTNKDPIPFMNEMKKESLQGYAYVSVLGSGTSNTEFEFLTGNSMAFLVPGSNAYQLYVKTKQPGITEKLKDNNYTTQALHPYFKANWNRPAVYKHMGFDKYSAIEDMFDKEIVRDYTNGAGIYYTLRRKLEERYGDKNVLLRRYVSDQYNFKELYKMQHKAGNKKPYFMFNVTMQNHSPYNLYIPEDSSKVTLKGMKGDYPKTEQYLTIINETDKALKKLIEHYRNVERPTIVLFFGDHQPFIEKGFYKEVMGSSMSDLDDEEKMKCYATRFMMWANYDIPTGWVDKISMNYLGVMLMEVAGMELSPYEKYLAGLYGKYPVVTAMGGFDASGKFVTTTEEELPELNLYRQLTFNNLIDTEHRVDKLF